MTDEQKDRMDDEDLEMDAEQAEDVKGGATIDYTRKTGTPLSQTTTTTTTTTTTSPVPPPPGSPTGATS